MFCKTPCVPLVAREMYVMSLVFGHRDALRRPLHNWHNWTRNRPYRPNLDFFLISNLATIGQK